MEKTAIERVQSQRAALTQVGQAVALVATGGGEAAGYALAQTVIVECQRQAMTWNTYVAKAWELSIDGRTALCKHLRKHLSDMRAHVKDAKGTEQDQVYAKAFRSAQTQISNVMMIANAFNGGYVLAVRVNPENGIIVRNSQGDVQPTQPFHTIVAECRIFKDTDAKGRGRPATPLLDKIKKLLNDNPDEFATRAKDIAELVASMASKVGKQEPAPM